jgi:hypothetical protein
VAADGSLSPSTGSTLPRNQKTVYIELAKNVFAVNYLREFKVWKFTVNVAASMSGVDRNRIDRILKIRATTKATRPAKLWNSMRRSADKLEEAAVRSEARLFQGGGKRYPPS